MSLLLDGGLLREAQDQVRLLDGQVAGDADMAFSSVRLSLMLRRNDDAERWTEAFRRLSPGGAALVRLGGAYETARLAGKAADFYQRALGVGHYPEAHLGLSRLAACRHDTVQAEQRALLALNLECSVGEDSAGVAPPLSPGPGPVIAAPGAQGGLPGLDCLL